MTPEEDSDDEVCLVEEGFVTEDMLRSREDVCKRLQSLLLAGAPTEVDIWSRS